jgi:hypothetical protein
LEGWRLNSPAGIRITTATLRPEEAEELAADLVAALETRSANYSA